MGTTKASLSSAAHSLLCTFGTYAFRPVSHGFVDLGFLEKYHFTVFQDAAFQFDSFLNCKLLEYLSVLLPFGLPISNLDGCKGDMVASTFGSISFLHILLSA